MDDKAEYLEYKSLLKILKARIPLAYPLDCRRAKLDDDTHGWCCRKGKKFIIRINRNLKEDLVIETLIHEYAHAISWNHLNDDMDSEDLMWHGPAWGVAYSQVYQVYEEFFIGIPKSAENPSLIGCKAPKG